MVPLRGTEGSNPLPSTSESIANQIFYKSVAQFTRRVCWTAIWLAACETRAHGSSAYERDVAMSWLYLFTDGLFEIGWPVGLKWAQEPGRPLVGVMLAVLSMAISGALLFLAQKEIALGTAYAVWTGIGAAGTFLIGIWLFGDPGSLGRYLGVVLIIAGVVTLKLAH
jgi:quaternary ammonium compound-resistance protein SugE